MQPSCSIRPGYSGVRVFVTHLEATLQLVDILIHPWKHSSVVLYNHPVGLNESRFCSTAVDLALLIRNVVIFSGCHTRCRGRSPWITPQTDWDVPQTSARNALRKRTRLQPRIARINVKGVIGGSRERCHTQLNSCIVHKCSRSAREKHKSSANASVHQRRSRCVLNLRLGRREC